MKEKLTKILLYLIGSILFSFALGIMINYIASLIEGTKGRDVFSSRMWLFIGLSQLSVIAVILYKWYQRSWVKGGEIIKEQNAERVDANLEGSSFMTSETRDKNFRKYRFEEIKEIESPGVIVRAECVKNDYEINFAKPSHTMIIGTTGSGKTTAYINPTIQILSKTKMKPSMLIADPKGELTSMHSKALIEQGYEVKVINLRNPFASVKWNPLEPIYEKYQQMLNIEKEIYRDEKKGVFMFSGKSYGMYEDAKKAAQVKKQIIYGEAYEDLHDIITGLCPVKNTKEPIWESGAQNFALAIALAMLEDSERKELGMTKERFNFYNLTKIAISSERNCQYLRKYFEGRGPLSKAASLSRQVLTAAENTRTSYLTTLYDKLGMFSDMGICSMTSSSEITFKDMSDSSVAIFLQIPDEKETRHILASLIVLQAYKELVAKANDEKDLTLKRPVCFILDEFGNLPKVHKLEQMVTVGRSRNIWLSLVIQSYAQLSKVYEEDAAEIIKANCNTQVFIGTTDQKTVEEFSKRCGKYTVVSKTVGVTKGDQEKVSENYRLEERPLIYPSELQRLNKPGDMGNAIVTVFGYEPLKTKFTPSYECPFLDCFLQEEIEKEGRFFEEDKTYYEMKKRASQAAFYGKEIEREGSKTLNITEIDPSISLEDILRLVDDILEDDEINELIHYISTNQKTKRNKLISLAKERAEKLLMEEKLVGLKDINNLVL